jgi:membrane-associated phospholipid phosphatase/tRNA A-37 threonylcarbamoyl transferase component Bud32
MSTAGAERGDLGQLGRTAAGTSERGRRRRPTGQAPALPRQIGASGRFWLILLGAVTLSLVLGVVLSSLELALRLERAEAAVLQGIAELRVPWLTDLAQGVNVLGGLWTNRILRWGVLVVLVFFRRWRHLLAFLGSVILVAWTVGTLNQAVARPRPLGVEILGNWSGYSFPSRPVATFTATLLAIAYTLIPSGRYRQWAKTGSVVLVGLLVLARLYLAQDHPLDAVVGVVFGVGISLVVYRLFIPSSVFPVGYGRGRAAHLDVTGVRGAAIRQAALDQLGLSILEVKPFGLSGSGGSTPLRLTVSGEPEYHLFGKIYAKTHLRADRWYKLGRTILYGTLEDEKAYNSVRRLVEYEDYILRVLRDAGIPTARSLGFVELTPDREYMLVTEFLEGGQEIGDVEIDEALIDDALQVVRRMWVAGVAHRDVKPANILVRDESIWLIDPAFGQIRPSPWRQAVDLANMMIVLGLKAEPKLVYERALRVFSPDEIAEAFAATRSVTMPSQSRGMLKARAKDGQDVLAEFRTLVPKRAPISIQRWSFRRVVLAFSVLFVFLLGIGLFLDQISQGNL